MEGLAIQKVTLILTCFVLFFFIFTTRVLSSRPHEFHPTRNDIHHVKPSHYVRTFTKYHHRRNIERHNRDISDLWSIIYDQPKNAEEKRIPISKVDSSWPLKLKTNELLHTQWSSARSKRSVITDSNELIGTNPKSNTDGPKVKDSVFVNKVIKTDGDLLKGLKKEHKKIKVLPAFRITDAPTTMGPTISCLYKIDSITRSVTPSYEENKNMQFLVETDNYDAGPITEMVLPSGPTLVEKCTDTRDSCYTLWHEDDEGNITVLGQGCWRRNEARNSCDKCTNANAMLPGTKFCCCTKTYCNADFQSLRVETVTIKAQSTMEATVAIGTYDNVYLAAVCSLAAVIVMAAQFYKVYCRKQTQSEASSMGDMEKGDVMGSGPDALATGLSCVDNLTLMEHIGQGKFGSVWRGSLGATPVAVKLYSNVNAWQREAAIYSLPHLSHPNLLRYFGSDTRPTLTEGGGREHLIVLELCSSTLRARLERAPLTWLEFATLAHGIASALAHLHTPMGNKPCVVHRDVNSCNVLVAGGAARLADLGLALPLHPARPPTISEAGTLRYLAPEALEGALDLSGCSWALCAVDVYALALVLWEMLCRTVTPTQPYHQPYHHLPIQPPTLQCMQNLVARNKMRPPMPKSLVTEARALKIASDTCEECWDHDAEARLTAVCVEERMNELKSLVSITPPHIHDNKINPHSHGEGQALPLEHEKNSNCTRCDAATPLLYPAHVGRNVCLQRNTHTDQHQEIQLIHKSLKDITVSSYVSEPSRANVEENCLSVARISHNRVVIPENSLNEIRSYQRPLEYVPNDVTVLDTERLKTKETNLLQDKEKPKWGFRRFLEKLNRKDTEVKLVPESSQRTKTSIVDEKSNVGYERPNNLILDDANFTLEVPCLSPPNRTLSPTMMEDKVFKELPRENESNQIFAVIVPKAKPAGSDKGSKSKGSSESINKQSVRTSMSSQSMLKSDSEDSTLKKRLSSENRTINSAGSSRASINLELQYIDNVEFTTPVSPFDINSDCSSSEDENLMLLSENGGSKITMHSVPKTPDVLKETTQTKPVFNKVQNKYANFDNEYSDPNDKENSVSGYSGDNPVYLAALNGEIDSTGLKIYHDNQSPKPCLKSLSIKRQHSLEQVSELFSSSGDVNLLNPAGRVKTPGDLPVAVRKARRDRALQKGRASECNRLSLYDDRMMFGNSL